MKKSIKAFLSHLDSMDIKLRADGDRLHCNAPKGTLTPVLSAELRERKAEIIAFLHNDYRGYSIRPISRDENLPLSFAQQRLYFLDQLDKGSSAYNMPSALRMNGNLDSVALERSLTEIVRRHEILRTTFQMKNGSPVQIVHPVSKITPKVIDLTDLRAPEQSVKVRHLADEEAQRPFDLAKGPLMRVILLKLGNNAHVLLLTMHHIVTDGWSVGILVREMSALYNAFSAGTPSPLPELPIQYADFAHWQLDWLKEEVLETQLDFFKQKLAGAPWVLELPTDRPRPSVQTFQGSTESIVIDAEIKQHLMTLGQQSGATLFMSLLAAFVILLYRYTSQADIVIGTPIANRNLPELEGLLGFFANTLVLRTTLADNPKFLSFLAQVREMTLGAYEHQDIPFEKLVEELHPERDISRNPLVQVILALQNAPMHAATQNLQMRGLQIEPVAFESGRVRLDLEVHLWEEPTGLKADFMYNTDLFERATIARMARHYRTLLQSIVASPELRVSELQLLPADEKQQMLVEWNDTRKAYSKTQCIHHVFENYAERTPNKIALVFEDQRLTYWELNLRANQLAHYLRRLGVGPDVLVGICVARTTEMMVGLLGILKAGGAYVPLEPTYPQDRLSFMLSDSQAPVLITQSSIFNAQLSTINLQSSLVCIDTDWEKISRESKENPNTETTSENLAYVIYTSGSTGRPKGVQINHYSVINLIEAIHPMLPVNERDVWSVFHTYAFDLSVWEIWSPLLSGARLVLVPFWTTQSPEAFQQLLYDEQVTVLNQTPSFMRQLMQTSEQGEILPSSLRVVICGGEALPRSLAARLLEKDISVWNFYGPTEATVWTIIKSVKSVDAGSGAVSIGRPIANTQIYLLAPNLQPVPIGIQGELHIGGECLARGYFNRPDMNEERFIPNHFSEEPSSRLYKTGDLARYLPNGDIEYFGRLDHQVKVRGFRIELGEIEALLAAHPGVKESVVIVREDHADDKRLTAYVVLEQNGYPSAGELRGFLREKLPEYMVPSAFVMLEAMPLSPNGKIDRQGLPAPDQHDTKMAQNYMAPRNEVEKAITNIWQETLHVEKIGIHDNFFDLGGYSFLMMQIHNKLLRETYNKDIRLLDLFRYPSIATLAQYLTQENDQQHSSGLKTVQARGRKHREAMSRQKRLMKQRRQK